MANDEPTALDHSHGLLVLRWVRGRLRLLRARSLSDAADRAEWFQ
jgi:hypothetical protein